MKFVSADYSPAVILDSAGPGRAVYARTDDYRLFVTDGTGNVSFVIGKDEPAVTISGKEKNKIIDDSMTDGKGKKYPNLNRSQVEAACHFTKYRPFIETVVCDEEGNFYVVRKRSVLDETREIRDRLFRPGRPFPLQDDFPV